MCPLRVPICRRDVQPRLNRDNLIRPQPNNSDKTGQSSQEKSIRNSLTVHSDHSCPTHANLVIACKINSLNHPKKMKLLTNPNRMTQEMWVHFLHSSPHRIPKRTSPSVLQLHLEHLDTLCMQAHQRVSRRWRAHANERLLCL